MTFFPAINGYHESFLTGSKMFEEKENRISNCEKNDKAKTPTKEY